MFFAVFLTIQWLEYSFDIGRWHPYDGIILIGDGSCRKTVFYWRIIRVEYIMREFSVRIFTTGLRNLMILTLTVSGHIIVVLSISLARYNTVCYLFIEFEIKISQGNLRRVQKRPQVLSYTGSRC